MVFDRRSGRTRPSTPGKEANSDDFYLVIRKDRGNPNIAEEALRDLERIFDPAIDRVNKTSGLPSDNIPLLTFIAVQFVRTQSAREWFDQANNTILMEILKRSVRNWETFVRCARRIFPNADDAELNEMFAEFRQLLQKPGARIKMDKTTLIRNAFDLIPSIVAELAKRYWLLGMAPKDASLITSDDPIILDWNGDGDPPKSWYPGFGDPRTVVLVSLGPQHILAGVSSEPRGKRRVQLTQKHVADFNTLVACRAARFVYYAEPSFPFHKDGTVVVGPTEWLKGDENDPRAGKKRGIVKVITER